MHLDELIQEDRILVLDACKDRDELLRRLAKAAGDLGPSEETLLEALHQREASGATSTPEGVAFPHALHPDIKETALVVALVRAGTAFGKSDHPHCDLIFCLFGEPSHPWVHVQLLARLARIARGTGAMDRLRACKDPSSLYAAMVEEDRSHV